MTQPPSTLNPNRLPLLLLVLIAGTFLALGWSPRADRFTWFMENFPVILGIPALIFMALGLSAAYELIEWQTAVWTGSAADAFLGTQGDPWDTQWDMACALIGASMALAILSRNHDRQIERLRH